MVSIAMITQEAPHEKKDIDKVVKVVILAIQQSTQLMVPILPTQLGHVWCRLHMITRSATRKKSY
jgi:hypothetical protein